MGIHRVGQHEQEHAQVVEMADDARELFHRLRRQPSAVGLVERHDRLVPLAAKRPIASSVSAAIDDDGTPGPQQLLMTDDVDPHTLCVE